MIGALSYITLRYYVLRFHRFLSVFFFIAWSWLQRKQRRKRRTRLAEKEAEPAVRLLVISRDLLAVETCGTMDLFVGCDERWDELSRHPFNLKIYNKTHVSQSNWETGFDWHHPGNYILNPWGVCDDYLLLSQTVPPSPLLQLLPCHCALMITFPRKWARGSIKNLVSSIEHERGSGSITIAVFLATRRAFDDLSQIHLILSLLQLNIRSRLLRWLQALLRDDHILVCVWAH